MTQFFEYSRVKINMNSIIIVCFLFLFNVCQLLSNNCVLGQSPIWISKIELSDTTDKDVFFKHHVDYLLKGSGV